MSRLIGLFLLIGCSTLSFANDFYPFAEPRQEAQFVHLLKELRCLVCQNQDLADSHASLAKDLRDQVYELVKQGKSDGDIVEYLRSRYGDFILFKPVVTSITALLWFGPWAFLMLGCLIFWRTCLKRTVHD